MQTKNNKTKQNTYQTGETIENLGNNQKYLVSDNTYNQNWWNWSYKNRWLLSSNKSKHSEFQSITKGYSNNPQEKPLNKICQKQYSKQQKDFVLDNRIILEENIALFCSISGDLKTLTRFLKI